MPDAKVIIDLCSSDEEQKEDSGDENTCEDVEEEELAATEEDSSFSGDDSDWSHDDAMESDEDDETGEKRDADDKFTRLLTAGSELKSLNMKECKAYLRKHGLRLSGTKAVCIERIAKHCRIKDGSGVAVYPRSSFVINCKGDVCKGDVILFTQKVHQKYEKMKRSGKVMGKRTVAGKVIKESYGTAKQQHTFTIEVLWCEGMKKLPPLYSLLVKGRNLYRLMTLRQRWANEQDRIKTLSEKHSRGAEARKVMRERKIRSGYVLKDGRLQKPDHVKKSCQVKTRKKEKDENLTQRFRQDIPANHSLVASHVHKNPTQLRNMNPSFHSYTSHSYAPPPRAPLTYAPPPPAPPPHAPLRYAPPPRATLRYVPPPSVPLTYAPHSYGPLNVPHSHLSHPNIPPSNSYAYSTQQNQRPPSAFYNKKATSNSLQGQVSFNPHANTQAIPVRHQSRPYQNHQTHHTSYNNEGTCTW